MTGNKLLVSHRILVKESTEIINVTVLTGELFINLVKVESIL